MNRLDASTLGIAAVIALTVAAQWRSEPEMPKAEAATVAPPPLPLVTPAAPPACAPLEVKIPPIQSIDGEPPNVPFEYGEGKKHAALAPFYEKVARLMRGKTKEPIRIAVYGDSNGTRDYLSGHVRRMLQSQWGDAGHGMMTLGRPWRWHSHMDVKFDDKTTSWGSFTVTSNMSYDAFYGHGLISAYNMHNGAVSYLGTVDPPSPVGRSASRLEVAYLEAKGMGSFAMRVDGVEMGRVDANGDKPRAAFAEVRVPDGAHKMEIVTTSPRHLRVFNMVIERDVPGFVVDGIGVGMLNCPYVMRDDAEVYKATFARRKYDLVIFHLGTLSNPREYASCMDKLLARQREAIPGVPVLVLSPPDFLNDRFTPPRPEPWVSAVRDAQRAYTTTHDLAFWDFFASMGGSGGMIRFERLHFSINDGVHLSEKGGAYMAGRLVEALWKDFEGWSKANPRAACD
jgi:hypothetical protein